MRSNQSLRVPVGVGGIDGVDGSVGVDGARDGGVAVLVLVWAPLALSVVLPRTMEGCGISRQH